MAQTISELEKERAKLLEAIEAQASQLSKQRDGTKNEAKPHTLNDWLNAAEQVVPSRNEPKMNYDDDYTALGAQRSNTKKTISPNFSMNEFNSVDTGYGVTSNNEPSSIKKEKPSAPSASQVKQAQKASFFGVIIMLSLLLTVLGVVYVAYNTVQRDLQQLSLIHNEALEELVAMKDEVAALRNRELAESDGFMIDQLMDRSELQQRDINNLTTKLDAVDLEKISTEVTRKISKQLDADIEARVQAYARQANIEINDSQQQSAVNVSANPEVVPRIEQRLVRLVETKPTNNPSLDWLEKQIPEHYLLQVASMPTQAGAEQVIIDKKILGAQVIPQTRDGRQAFVIVMGSTYLERINANQKAIEVKEQTGLSPWIRRVRDLTGRVE